MATEVSRTQYGMTEKGQVVILVLNNTGDDGEDNLIYQVRHGVRTVADFTQKRHAESLAKALVSESDKTEPEEESVTVDSAAANVPEPANQTVTRGHN